VTSFNFNNMFKKIFNFLGEHVVSFINNGGWLTVLVLGFIGLVCAIVGHYGTVGFNWKWFLFFELPLYVFCGWAIWVGIIKPIKNNRDIFKL